jgi:hypothetical protein
MKALCIGGEQRARRRPRTRAGSCWHRRPPPDRGARCGAAGPRAAWACGGEWHDRSEGPPHSPVRTTSAKSLSCPTVRARSPSLRPRGSRSRRSRTRSVLRDALESGRSRERVERQVLPHCFCDQTARRSRGEPWHPLQPARRSTSPVPSRYPYFRVSGMISEAASPTATIPATYQANHCS